MCTNWILRIDHHKKKSYTNSNLQKLKWIGLSNVHKVSYFRKIYRYFGFIPNLFNMFLVITNDYNFKWAGEWLFVFLWLNYFQIDNNYVKSYLMKKINKLVAKNKFLYFLEHIISCGKLDKIWFWGGIIPRNIM